MTKASAANSRRKPPRREAQPQGAFGAKLFARISKPGAKSNQAGRQANPSQTKFILGRFVGYQWLHPGGTVPAPFGDPANPTALKVPDMSKGFGSALTYNFDRHWGAEFDLGHNWGSGNYETTASVGPRFIVRTDYVNYFLHSLVSMNRLAIGGLNASNGIGVILGGGMAISRCAIPLATISRQVHAAVDRASQIQTPCS